MLFPELVQVLDPEPHSAANNMAIDEVLLRAAEQPTLRIYGWREPALSFGYFGRIAEVEAAAADRALVRRWTGGGLVEHGADLTYTLIVPREHAFLQAAAPESYRLIHEAIGAMLRREGMRVETVAAASAGGGGACFVNPVQYDLVAEERKIAGAAQRRTRWGLLHQGSIQVVLPPAQFAGQLAGAIGGTVSRRELTAEVFDAARVLAEEKYGTREWLRKY